MRSIRTEAQLRAEIARLEKKVARSCGKADKEDELAHHFSHGVGQMTARQAERRQRSHDAQLAAIRERAQAQKDLTYLRNRLLSFEAGECHANGQPRADAPSRQLRKRVGDVYAEYIRAHVRKGDAVEFLPNPNASASIVRRLNPKTISLEPHGTTWSYSDVRPLKADGAKYSDKEIAQVVAAWCATQDISV
jgi:hypothetical protein